MKNKLKDKPISEMTNGELSALLKLVMKEMKFRNTKSKISIILADAFAKATKDEAEEESCKFRNSSWTKLVTGIDKTKKGGYSLIGSFVSDINDKQLCNKESIFVNCCVQDGEKTYRLFWLDEKGKMHYLAKNNSIANFWDKIEKLLEKHPKATVAFCGDSILTKLPEEAQKQWQIRNTADEIQDKIENLRESLVIFVKDLHSRKKKEEDISLAERVYDSLNENLSAFIFIAHVYAELFNKEFNSKKVVSEYQKLLDTYNK